ncbi:MFS transporter [Paracoccus aminophilus]|uniref:Metabolite-proton symporter n=1 Tax=Paracoccus aminophilus JCM 7686 TaxID=1367847 RepID=S5Y2U8_PARAH|nr:MFS transporter [Paracoccus aminophilus]AGT10050.1 metabolite-proton symporter [Paracoccus aminophilus JCM 7686]
MATSAADVDRSRPMTGEEKKVILASSLGTVFEWYDFYLYGSLAAIIGAQFFTAFPEATRNVFALLAFAAGFIVRPLGALVFGSLGDLVGRKYTFLMTILIMGISTFIVGLLPGYESWGVAAPIILIALRMLQGLALGGEYGGAATYVAEHAPAHRRGYYTSWIQTTATLGLLLSLVIILIVQSYVNGNYPTVPQFQNGEPLLGPDGAQVMLEPFRAWGWRIPFLVSVILLAVSLYIRLQMEESPAFKKMKEEGATSKAPLREAFGQWKNAKIALIALFGLTAGQAVVWYSGQFYALFFINNVVKVDSFTSNVLIAWALILGTAGFVFFGSLSDRIGRKPIILGGCLLAALTFFPVFHELTKTANPALANAQDNTTVVVTADPATCSFQFNPTGASKFTSSCDIAKALLAKSSVNYTTEKAPAGTVATVRVGEQTITAYEGTLTGDEAKAAKAAFETQVNDALKASGYPLVATENTTIAKASNFFDIFTAQKLKMVVLLTYLIILVTMVYGPMAAALVELFPTRIRYSGMSLPYHIGNGWFGGLLPATAFAISAQEGNIYAGLWYAVVIAAATVVIGLIFVPSDGHKRSLFADDPGHDLHKTGYGNAPASR